MRTALLRRSTRRAALALTGCLAAASTAAAACFPEEAPAHLIGRYFVHERPGPNGVSVNTSVIAGRSDEGGLITCFYEGRPGALGALRTVLATDEGYNFAWSLDPATGRKKIASPQQRACDLSLGPCETRRRLTGFGQPTEVRRFDRRCEDGAFVKIILRPRFEGGLPGVRERLADQARRRPPRRVEIRYREDGAILSSRHQIGPRRGAASRLVEEGAWTGPSCLPGDVG